MKILAIISLIIALFGCGKDKPVIQVFSIKNDFSDSIRIEIFATQSPVASYEMPAGKESLVKHGWKCDTYCGVSNYGRISVNVYNPFDTDSRCIYRAQLESKCDCHDGHFQITCGPSGCQGAGIMNGASPMTSTCRKN